MRGLTLFRGPPLARPVLSPTYRRLPLPLRCVVIVIHFVRCLEFWIAPDRQLRVITGISLRWTLMAAIPLIMALPVLLLLKYIANIILSIVALALIIVKTFIYILIGLIVIWLLLELIGWMTKSSKRHGRR